MQPVLDWIELLFAFVLLVLSLLGVLPPVDPALHGTPALKLAPHLRPFGNALTMWNIGALGIKPLLGYLFICACA